VPNNRQNNRQAQNNNQDEISQVMNEVGQELGVDENTRQLNEEPRQFAERLKKAIRRRK